MVDTMRTAAVAVVALSLCSLIGLEVRSTVLIGIGKANRQHKRRQFEKTSL